MKNVISTSDAPKAIGPYSQAIEANGTLYISGQIPIDPKTGQLCDDDIKAQTRVVLDNIAAILKAAGLEMRHVVKTTCLLSDMNDFSAMNEAYAEYFKENPPARSAFAAKGLPKGARLEIEAIAVGDTITDKFSTMARNIFDEVAEKAKQASASINSKEAESQKKTGAEPEAAQPNPDLKQIAAPEEEQKSEAQNQDTSAQEKSTQEKINESIDEAKEKIKGFFNGLMDEIKKAK